LVSGGEATAQTPAIVAPATTQSDAFVTPQSPVVRGVFSTMNFRDQHVGFDVDAADSGAESFRVRSILFGRADVDQALLDEAVQAVGEVVHPFVDRASHNRREVFIAAVANAIGNQSVVEQDLRGRDPLHALFARRYQA